MIEGLVKRPHCCHCDERSDAAISTYQADTNYEIAEFIPSHNNEIASPSARNDDEGPLAKTAFLTFYECIMIATRLPGHYVMNLK